MNVMINKYLKIYLYATVMLGDFLMFAQDPGTDLEDENGEIDGSVEDAPINGKLIWLAIAGIFFSFYYFKKMQISSNEKYAGASQSKDIE